MGKDKKEDIAKLYISAFPPFSPRFPERRWSVANNVKCTMEISLCMGSQETPFSAISGITWVCEWSCALEPTTQIYGSSPASTFSAVCWGFCSLSAKHALCVLPTGPDLAVADIMYIGLYRFCRLMIRIRWGQFPPFASVWAGKKLPFSDRCTLKVGCGLD